MGLARHCGGSRGRIPFLLFWLRQQREQIASSGAGAAAAAGRLAGRLASRLAALEEVTSVEVAGPGFVNVTFSAEFLSAQLAAVAVDDRLGVRPAPATKTVVVETKRARPHTAPGGNLAAPSNAERRVFEPPRPAAPAPAAEPEVSAPEAAALEAEMTAPAAAGAEAPATEVAPAAEAVAEAPAEASSEEQAS